MPTERKISARSRFLWLARSLPLPPSSGDRVYSAGLADALARAGGEITYVGLANPDEDMGPVSELSTAVSWRLVPGAPVPKTRALLSSMPLVAARFATKPYRQFLDAALATGSYEAIVLDQYGMSWTLPYLEKAAKGLPIVYIAHNDESKLNEDIASDYRGNPLRKFLLRRNAVKTRPAETRLVKACQILVTLTDEDRRSLTTLNPAVRAVVIPPGYLGPRQAARTITADIPRRATVVGSFSWTAKQMNLERLIAATERDFGEHSVELHVIGKVPEALLARVKDHSAHVTFRGYVDDLASELANARIALIPEETGGGFKLKTLDYIFSRVPVAAISSALSGLPEDLRREFLVADDLASLSRLLVHRIDDLPFLQHSQERAFDIAKGAFDWQENGRVLLDEIRRL